MIIGLSGYKQSGKDTVCKIIQYFMFLKKFPTTNWSMEQILNSKETQVLLRSWENKKFADKLKDIVCLLLGCTREQLEDNKYKETLLGEEWRCQRVKAEHGEGSDYILMPYHAGYDINKSTLLTPRLLLQLLGTECGRNIIHPNIWVNALMSEYSPGLYYMCDECGAENILPIEFEGVKDDTCPRCKYESESNLTQVMDSEGNNWIITDVRFINEAQAIKDRGGLVLRIHNPRINSTDLHESEIALDYYEGFDDIIYNNSTIPVLVTTMQQTLQHFKII